MEDHDLSIIIVSYNTKDLLRNCIRSIYATVRNCSYDIIVVDNGSKDGSPDMIEAEFDHTRLRLIRNKENLGFARANNQALNIGKGNYFLLLNSDTILENHAIERLVRFLDKHPRAAAVGPKVSNLDGTLQSKGFHFPSIIFSLITLLKIHIVLPKAALFQLFPRFFWGENVLRCVDWVSGCCILIRKSAMDRIGPLSEDFFMYFEEVEWCFRANKNKYEIWYFPSAEIIHYNQSSPLYKRSQALVSSKKLLYEKTIGRHRGIIISFLTVSSVFIKVLFFKFISKRSDVIEYSKARESLAVEFQLLRSLL